MLLGDKGYRNNKCMLR